MIQLLSRLFIKDPQNYSDGRVRTAYGTLCSVVGILLNVLMFAGKFLAGTLTGSISISADAFNNLSDAGTSVISLLGFKLASKKPDPTHPFGHGRFEYISGLIISLLILLLGFELARSSFEKILNPEPNEWNLLSVIILAVAIAVKLYMSLYNSRIGKKINSSAMKATAADSLGDVVSTSVVLISTLLSHFFGWSIDAYAGLFVALFIMWNGFNAARETISPMLGEPADPELIEKISSIVLASDEVCGLHDLIVHDYGPGRTFISLHAEVPCDHDVMEIHDAIDNLEVQLYRETGCLATIHMDPVQNNDPVVMELKDRTEKIVAELMPTVSLHDFRTVPGSSHTNLIFDIILPYDVMNGKKAMTEAEAVTLIRHAVYEKIGTNYHCVIHVDRPFI